MELSVVVASVESARSLRDCLSSLRTAVAGLDAEIIVTDASRDASASIAAAELGEDAVIRCAPGALTPELWAVGIARTTGRTVVLTTGHFVVERSWALRLMAAITGAVKGAAGSLALLEETAATDWAVFYLRYAEFLVEPDRLLPGISMIPADNAAYDGESIRRHVSATGDGFWEVEFHRELHGAGAQLAIVPGAVARFGPSFPFLTIVSHRLRHGRHAGAWRVGTGQRSAAAIVAAAPFVPFVLAARAWRRVRTMDEHRSRFLRALPSFLVLAGVWAAGEVFGALQGPRVSPASASVPA